MEKLLTALYPNSHFKEGYETAVVCPFHDDKVGSMHIRSVGEDFVYHCKACDVGGNAIDYMAKYLKTTAKAAQQFLETIKNSSYDIQDWKERIANMTEDNYKLLTRFGISKSMLERSGAGTLGTGISFPIDFEGIIVDIRTYIESRSPKVKSILGAKTGFLVPSIGLKGNKVVLTEGEKDALTLLSQGIPAASVTGGCQAIPDKVPYLLDGKEITILYDNDDPGREGALKVAEYLLRNEQIKVTVKIADIKELVKDKPKGDVTDYFVEFNGTREELVNKCLKTAVPITLENLATKPDKKLKTREVKLSEADKYVNEWLESVVQVSATTDSSYTIPATIKVNYMDTYGNPHQEQWQFKKYSNIENIIDLVDDGTDKSFIKKLVGNLTITGTTISDTRIPIYSLNIASTATDTSESGKQATEHAAYIVGSQLDSGKDYKIVYKIIPNHNDGNKSIVLIASAKDMAKDAENFQITKQVIDSLDKVSSLTFDQLIENAKGHINADFNSKLVTVSELTYNSVFEFNMGRYKNLKGCIDSIIVTDTGFGKSITAERLMRTYGVGTRVSLVGSAATPQGLIGGSKAVGKSFQTTAGVIPRNHKGLIMLEELGKNKSDIIKELTDIRTSGKAEIARVSGKISLPASLRMLFSSNPKSDSSGTNKTVDSYANGIEIIQDLLGAREDIGRFDLISILGQSESKNEDPFWQPVQHLTADDMKNKIHWIWTRKTEDIIFEEAATNKIIELQKSLNEDLECDVQIFGRKTWLKLAKVAASVAAYQASHSDDYTKILVKTEHVEKASEILRNLFDNKTFKLKEYVAQERAYTRMDEGATAIMSKMYVKQNQLITQLGIISEIQTRELETVANLDKDAFNQVISDLVRFFLVRNIKGKIIPTEKFRKTYEVVKTAKIIMDYPETVEEEMMKGGR